MHPFIAYYIRCALPFMTGVAFAVFAERMNLSLLLSVPLGATLVVLGPFLIEVVLTLVVDALRGPTPARVSPFDLPSQIRR